MSNECLFNSAFDTLAVGSVRIIVSNEFERVRKQASL